MSSTRPAEVIRATRWPVPPVVDTAARPQPATSSVEVVTPVTAPVPPVEVVDEEILRKKMEEKRRLAENHSGEDHTPAIDGRLEEDKQARQARTESEMPGVHPSIAEKLLARRQAIEEA